MIFNGRNKFSDFGNEMRKTVRQKRTFSQLSDFFNTRFELYDELDLSEALEYP